MMHVHGSTLCHSSGDEYMAPVCMSVYAHNLGLSLNVSYIQHMAHMVRSTTICGAFVPRAGMYRVGGGGGSPRVVDDGVLP
jgi:hypothetical protein